METLIVKAITWQSAGIYTYLMYDTYIYIYMCPLNGIYIEEFLAVRIAILECRPLGRPFISSANVPRNIFFSFFTYAKWLLDS